MMSFLLNVLRYWIALYAEYTEGHISRGNAPKCILVCAFRSSPKVIDVTQSFLFFFSMGEANIDERLSLRIFLSKINIELYEIRWTSDASNTYPPDSMHV